MTDGAGEGWCDDWHGVSWSAGCGRCGFGGPSGHIGSKDYRAFDASMRVNVFNLPA
ncbi:hypothetical protein GWL_19150 [Herbaspirillum sp. GW103]|nr:hypothetical protein GWL_19150 [Herbaspirillum sp. GW103]